MWGVKIARLFFVGSCLVEGGFSLWAASFSLWGRVCAVVDSSVGGCKRKAPAFCRACVCSRGCGVAALASVALASAACLCIGCECASTLCAAS